MDKYERVFIAERRNNAAKNGGDSGSDLLGKMMETHVAGSSSPISDADVQANVREAFVAGSETTGAAIAITLHQISSNPRIEWLVRRELREVLGDKGLPTYEELEKLTDLKMCIRETLRMYPSAHVFGRQAEEDMEVHTHTHILSHTYTCTHTHTHTHTCARAHMHTHAHSYTHIPLPALHF
jgi:cytochrome P450